MSARDYVLPGRFIEGIDADVPRQVSASSIRCIARD